MPLKALFDDGRKKEIQFALRSGKPLPFHAREPKSEDTDAGSVIDKQTFYEGTIAFLDTCKLGGFSFTYYGHAKAGGIGIGIQCGNDMTKTAIVGVGQELAINHAQDATRMRIRVIKADDTVMTIRLDLETGMVQ